MYRLPTLLTCAFLVASLAWTSDLRAQCSAGDQVGADCGTIPFEGCCDAEGWTKWCEGGVLCGIDCGIQGNSCGWSVDAGFYDCDQVGPDPSGTFPLDCDGGVVNPSDCLGTDAPTSGTCPVGLDYTGCCGASNRVWWCDGGSFYCLDCSGNTPPDDECGWNAEAGFYDCSGVGADPAGTYPLECPTGCLADCTGKVCGDDGCGGSCGTCPIGQSCQNGTCSSCTADCTGKECGGDGCGGDCGSCQDGYSCKGGTCIKNQVCVPACDGKECGPDGCDGVCGVCVPPRKCNASGTCYDPGSCMPSCDGKQCGSDGCEGSCGTCNTGLECNPVGICVDPGLVSNDVPVMPGVDASSGTDGSGVQCPAGYVSFYGICKPLPKDDEGEAGGSDCAISPVSRGPWVLLPALLMGLTLLWSRRRT